MYQKPGENKIIKTAYEMSEKIYRMKSLSMKNLGVEIEDFQQDAALYILNLYRKDYMYLDKDRDARGMVFKMLSQYSQNYFRKYLRNKGKHAGSLNNSVNKNVEKLELISREEQLNPEDWSVINLEKIRGEKLLKEIIEQLNILPFKTRKHEYIGKENKKLSEYNLAKMIISGYTMKDILKEYNVYTPNTGTSSKAVFVNKKVHEVSDKLKSIVNKLDENDREAITYFVVGG